MHVQPCNAFIWLQVMMSKTYCQLLMVDIYHNELTKDYEFYKEHPRASEIFIIPIQ